MVFFRWRRWCVYWWMWCKLHGMRHGSCLPSVARLAFTMKRWEGYIARRFARIWELMIFPFCKCIFVWNWTRLFVGEQKNHRNSVQLSCRQTESNQIMEIESIQSSRVYRINLIANLAAPIDDMLTLMMWKETTCQSPTISDRAYHNIYCHRFWLFWRPFFRIQQKSLQTFELTERFRWYHLNGMNILSSFANRKTLFQKCLKFVFLPYRVTF